MRGHLPHSAHALTLGAYIFYELLFLPQGIELDV